MLDWNDLRYFLAVQRAGSLAGAASTLGINPTTVSRRISALEQSMQARVFDRTPEGYILTGAGKSLMLRAEQMEAAALALERDVQGADRRLAGTVRIATTEMIATRLIAPQLPSWSVRHPEITVELACSTQMMSLSRGEADVALRLLRPQEEDVVPRRLTSLPLALYGARSYLEQHGVPRDPEETLQGQRVIMLTDARVFQAENAWLQARLGGASPVLRSDSVSSIYAATAAGLGLSLLPRRIADGDPLLVRLPTRSSPEPRVLWAASHEAVQQNARIRAVLSFLADVFAVER